MNTESLSIQITDLGSTIYLYLMSMSNRMKMKMCELRKQVLSSLADDPALPASESLLATIQDRNAFLVGMRNTAQTALLSDNREARGGLSGKSRASSVEPLRPRRASHNNGGPSVHQDLLDAERKVD